MSEEQDPTATPDETEDDDQLQELIGGLEERLAERLTGAIEKRLEQRFDSIADRRVNAILKEIRKQHGGEQQNGPKPVESTQNVQNDRTRRALLKSAVQNELLMRSDLSNEEKQLAQSLVFEMVENRPLSEDDDEFTLAKQLVESAAGTLSKARETYQEQLRENLKARGLVLDGDGEGQQKKRPKSGEGSDLQAFDKGAEIARRRGYAGASQEGDL